MPVFDVDLDQGHVDAVHVGGVLLAFAGVGVESRGQPDVELVVVTGVLGGDALGDHLRVGAIGPVFLAHGVHQLVGRVDGGVARHVVRAAGGGQVGVGADLAVVHDQPHLVRPDAQRLERLHRVGQGTDVAALAHVLPGVVVGDGAVGVELQGHLGGVEHADGDDEPAQAHPHAHVPALGSWPPRPRPCTGRTPAWPSRAGSG